MDAPSGFFRVAEGRDDKLKLKLEAVRRRPRTSTASISSCPPPKPHGRREVRPQGVRREPREVGRLRGRSPPSSTRMSFSFASPKRRLRSSRARIHDDGRPNGTLFTKLGTAQTIRRSCRSRNASAPPRHRRRRPFRKNVRQSLGMNKETGCCGENHQQRGPRPRVLLLPQRCDRPVRLGRRERGQEEPKIRGLQRRERMPVADDHLPGLREVCLPEALTLACSSGCTRFSIGRSATALASTPTLKRSEAA